MSAKLLRNCQGSAIVAAAVTAGVLSILVAGYLTYMTNEYRLNYRSHRWTQALHLAEAGVEVGFAEFNYQYYQGGSGFQSARGWTDLGSGSYSKSVSNLTDTAGNVVGDFTVTVSGVGAANPQVLGVATCTNAPSGPSVTRAVKVIVKKSSRYPVGMMSKDTMDLNGNNVYTDSYDSTDPTKSTSGQYDANKKQAHGDIASDASVVNSVSVVNADVYGQVYTGSAGTVTMGPNGSVGTTFVDANRATTVAQGESSGWIRHDFDVDVPDVTLPSGASSWSSLGDIKNDTTINGGDWRASDISLHGNQTLTITNGTVRLYVTGDIGVSGNGSIVIAGNAKLEVYAADDVSIAGKGVVNNTGVASNNQFFGLSSSTDWSVDGNGQWVGTMYAPEAAFSLKGGGSNGDMSGSVVANTITLSGQVQFHYDESLKTSDTGAAYVVASWQSLRNVDGSWVAE